MPPKKSPKLSLDALNLERIKKAVGHKTFTMGEELYKLERVAVNEITPKSAHCTVHDKHPYGVEIKVAPKYLYLKCDCRYSTRGIICKHEIAACLAVRDSLRRKLPPAWKRQLNSLQTASHASLHKTKTTPYILLFSLQGTSVSSQFAPWAITPYKLPASSLPKDIRHEKNLRHKSELQDFLEKSTNLNFKVKQYFTKLNPEGCLNSDREGIILANLLVSKNRNYRFMQPELSLADQIEMVATSGAPLFFGDWNYPFHFLLNILQRPAQLGINIDLNKRDLQLNAFVSAGELRIDWPANSTDELTKMQVVCLDPLWILNSNKLFKIDDPNQIQLFNTFSSNPEILIPSGSIPDFQNNHLVRLAHHFNLHGDLVNWETISTNPIPRIYLTDADGEIRAKLRFGYGEHEVNYETPIPAETILHIRDTWTLLRIQRIPEKETNYLKKLSSASYGLKRTPRSKSESELCLRARTHPVDFLLNHVPRLARNGVEIYGEEKLKTARVNRNTPKISFHVASGIDWFDIQTVVQFGDLEVDIKSIRRMLRKKERYIKLADGTIGEIPEDWLERYIHLLALSQESDAGLRLSSHHINLIDQLLQESDETSFDAEYKQRRERLKDFSGITTRKLPGGFVGQLRPYQQAGYDWLHFLQEFNFGGCLADDMGLGKTIQALVFFQSIKESETQDGKEIMRRDIKFLRNYRFHYVILDESQVIKNPSSQTSKAARLLQARFRLALTGTPIENSTLELWSLFAFLNPGLLGSLEYFKKEFVTPIERKGDENKAQFLRQMIYPFILRRTKGQVAPELPPRSERVIFIDMEPAQRNLYNRTRDYYRGILLGMIEGAGFNKSRFKILEGLLRLRQICNHPRLIDEQFRGESGKFSFLLEILDTLRAEGHKALVFSQFVQMLTIVRHSLDDRKILYEYLDGQTRNRQERVDNFQNNPDIPLFLISLKAGGLGLNLTAADYVIHIDPWWNPAVEIQATDRTHRIGQENPVFVYKLITRDSVEEKIVQLQINKKNLVNQLITTERSFFKSLNAEDINNLFS
jgi:non-specific serine/threonine protein kinase